MYQKLQNRPRGLSGRVFSVLLLEFCVLKAKKLSGSLRATVSRRPAELSYRRFTELRALSNTLRYSAYAQGAADLPGSARPPPSAET